jgi:hemin uptake protein HemP
MTCGDGGALDRPNNNDYRSRVDRGRRRSAAGERDPLEGQPPASRAEARRISSLELLGEQGELIIEHDGRDYRLRLTQNGKLILTA